MASLSAIMKMKPRCVPCLLNRVLFECELVTENEEEIASVMKQVLQKMAENYSSTRSSAEIATEIHRYTYELLGNSDPYKKLKDKSNEVALSLLPKVKEIIENSDDELHTAILCSIAGNSIDFGIAGSASKPEELATKFDWYVQQGLYHDDVERMRKYLKGGSEVLYFTDNCGEIVFDRVVCEILKTYDIHLTLVCKEVPILTDATLEDVKKLGFDEVVDEIITTGKFAVGVDVREMPEVLREKLNAASLIISKGMANYEALSETEYAPIAHLMRVKCLSIAESVGVPQGVNVAKLYK